jgi:subtilisin family serine protease
VTDVASITVDGIALVSTDWVERLSMGQLFPSAGVWARDSEIVIVYSAGYGTDRAVVQAAVPQAVTAVKMLVAQMHENREGVKSVSIDGVGSTTYDTDQMPGWQKRVWPLKVNVL